MERLLAKHRLDPTDILRRSLGRMAEVEENNSSFEDAYEIFELCLGMSHKDFQKQLLVGSKTRELRRVVEQGEMDALLRHQMIRRLT